MTCIVSEPSSFNRGSAADCPISTSFLTFTFVVSNRVVVSGTIRVFQQFSSFPLLDRSNKALCLYETCITSFYSESPLCLPISPLGLRVKPYGISTAYNATYHVKMLPGFTLAVLEQVYASFSPKSLYLTCLI